jgi:hypothetical protein
MIKPSTVIRRMVQDNWRPVAGIVAMIVAVMLFSLGVSYMFDVSASAVYYTTMAVLALGFFTKWAYDWKKADIEFEQRQMLRDLEGKHKL